MLRAPVGCWRQLVRDWLLHHPASPMGAAIVMSATVPGVIWWRRALEAFGSGSNLVAAASSAAGLAAAWCAILALALACSPRLLWQLNDKEQIDRLHRRLGTAAVDLTVGHILLNLAKLSPGNWISDIPFNRVASSAYLTALAALLALAWVARTGSRFTRSAGSRARNYRGHRRCGLIVVIFSLWHEVDAMLDAPAVHSSLVAAWIAIHAVVLLAYLWAQEWRAEVQSRLGNMQVHVAPRDDDGRPSSASETDGE